MTRTIPTLLLGAVLGAASTGIAVANGPRSIDTAAHVLALAQQEAYALSVEAGTVRDPGTARSLARSTDRLQQHLAHLQVLVDTERATGRPGPPPRRLVRVIDDTEVSRLVATLDRTTWDDDKLAVLGAWLPRNLTVAHTRRILGTFDWDDDTLAAARMLRPSVVDAHDWYLLADSVTFSSNRQAMLDLAR